MKRAILLLLPFLAACGGPPALVRILEVNDIHVLDEESMAYPSRVVDAMNGEKADLVLVCGDVATDGKEGELLLARKVLDRFVVPYHVVAGNHDALHKGDREEELFKRVFEQKETTYAFESHGIHFVAIDPGCGSNYKENRVPPAVVERLRAIAAAIPPDRPVILFSHYAYGTGVSGRTPNADEVLGLFKGRRLLAVLSGHWHGNTERREGGVLFTTTACASSTRNNHDKTTAKGYRVLIVREGREVSTEFKAVPTGEAGPR